MPKHLKIKKREKITTPKYSDSKFDTITSSLKQALNCKALSRTKQKKIIKKPVIESNEKLENTQKIEIKNNEVSTKLTKENNQSSLEIVKIGETLNESQNKIGDYLNAKKVESKGRLQKINWNPLNKLNKKKPEAQFNNLTLQHDTGSCEGTRGILKHHSMDVEDEVEQPKDYSSGDDDQSKIAGVTNECTVVPSVSATPQKILYQHCLMSKSSKFVKFQNEVTVFCYSCWDNSSYTEPLKSWKDQLERNLEMRKNYEIRCGSKFASF